MESLGREKKKRDEIIEEGKDYYFDSDGRMVLTADYLLRRGECCQSGCRHCPYSLKTKTKSHKE